MKRKICVAIYLVMGSMMMSCSIDQVIEELEEAVPMDCLTALSRMTQIQLQLDNPNLPDAEKRKLIEEYSQIEGWAERNCGE
ncbi:hypothetical protein [Parapedobacter sp. 2B3]|uniref:hypothetical protein n=1 Tax=Parapedobacter sp. 2B3 TaxID=3342381 RepID=UPI0035B5B8F9